MLGLLLSESTELDSAQLRYLRACSYHKAGGRESKVTARSHTELAYNS